VPYLDVLGVAEGAILLICASLPTLGPVIRLVRDRVTRKPMSCKPSDSSGGSSGTSDGQWSRHKGQKLDDGEHACIRGLHSSEGDIPLATNKRLAADDVEAGHTTTVVKNNDKNDDLVTQESVSTTTK